MPTPLAILLALVALLPIALRVRSSWRRRRALIDPAVDPGAAEVDDADRARLNELLAWAPKDNASGTGSQGVTLAEGWALLDAHRGSSATLAQAAAKFGAELIADPRSVSAQCGLAECALFACYCHGEMYWRAGLRQALPLIERALVLSPGDPTARAIHGMYLVRLGEVRRAEAIARELPADDWRAAQLVAVCAQVRGRRREAVKALQRAAESAPPGRKPSLLNSLGLLLASRGKSAEAIAAYRACLELEPGYAWAWHNLSLAHYRLGNFHDALGASDRALEIGEFLAARQLNDHLRRRLGKGWSPEGA